MKQMITLLLSALLALSLAACGGGNDKTSNDPLMRDDGTTQEQHGQPPDAANTPGNTAPDIDFGAVMDGKGAADTVWGKQDESTKQAIIADAKKDGLDVSFGTDGSMTVKDPGNGETFVQNPDGTWTYQDEKGEEAQIGGNWPDNEFTKLLPKPDFELTATSGDDSIFTATFTGATIEQIRDYTEKVKSAGFTVDPEEMDTETMGMAMFSYSASNGKGYTAMVNFANETSYVSVGKK